ncbi:ABC transporter substrate-binding protein [Microbacterium sp. SSW1-49]|uniref:ABC transporter substrate-binding protein n=1 Tax=Microbacterium croceum TaxID=2851645 RepID=A0ABT0FD90_9MICO|nr:ABC transporter substrate-binding protein [Microbacterium croceum]MCK2035716.1 ABC transporter substrate-binding protein [Microbacterium croceum]
MRNKILLTAGIVAAVSITLAGCTYNDGGSSGSTSGPAESQVITVDYEGSAEAPAAEVVDAVSGGEVIIADESPFESTDPAALNVSAARSVGTELLFRTLTTYLTDGESGDTSLVGDLATNAGSANEDDTVWTYTLREGITFEDGTPITAQDVAYGIARSFTTLGVAGEQNLQDALDPDRAYQGPYDGELLPPGVTTPDEQTIVFTLDQPTPLLPYFLSTANTSPVPADADTRQSYGSEFVSTGPYRLGEYVPEQYMVLVRNEGWDPETDPVRHQYPDSYRIEFNVSASTQVQRALASQGADGNLLGSSNVPQQDMPSVTGDDEANIIAGAIPATYFITINTERVTDLAVRQALNYAIDRDGLAKARGGVNVATPLNTILPSALVGYVESDTYPMSPDVEAAEKALDGQTPELTYCYANSTLGNGDAVVVQSSLEAAGFKINLNPIEGASYVSTVRNPDSGCDLFFFSWAPAYPDPSAVMNPLLNGASGINLSLLDDKAVNDELATLAGESDRAVAAPQYGELDKTVMTDQVPMIPTVSENVYQLAGSNVKGSFVNPIRSFPSLVNIYLEQ